MDAEKLAYVRYRGDLEDIKDLYEHYKIDAYVQTFEEAKKNYDNLRNQLLKTAVKLDPVITPRVCKIMDSVKKRLDIPEDIEFYVTYNPSFNAYAFEEILPSGKKMYLVVLTSNLIENFSENQIAFVIGHEIGHILFNHHKLIWLSRVTDMGMSTLLPPLAEMKYLQWMKKGEISCDRIGLIASGDFEASAYALLKSHFGLSEKNITPNIDKLMEQIEEVKKEGTLSSESFATHPILPVRLKSLEYFYRSEVYGLFDKNVVLYTKEELEARVDELVNLTRRYPKEEAQEALMKLIAIMSLKMFWREGMVNKEELKTLIKILSLFTDDPEKELDYSTLEEIEPVYEKYLKVLKEKGSPDMKGYLIHSLTHIAISDGNFLPKEKEFLFRLAKELGLDENTTYAIIVSVINQVGFKKDYRLEELVQSISSKLNAALKVKFRGE